jgi:hypothetical protein
MSDQNNNADPDVMDMQKLVDKALGKDRYTYPMQVNAPKPKPPFASVRKMQEQNPGRDRTRIIEKNNKFFTEVTGVRLLDFEILFTEGTEEQSKFISSLHRADMQGLMTQLDMTVLEHATVRNDSVTLETNWEIRDGVLVRCMVRRTYLWEEGTIESTIVDGVVNEGDATVEITVEASSN